MQAITWMMLLLLAFPLFSFPEQQETTQPIMVYDEKFIPMVWVPEGEFTAGYTFQEIKRKCEALAPDTIASWCSEEILRESYETTYQDVVESFFIDQYEVSIVDYMLCVDSHVCSDYAVRNISDRDSSLPIDTVDYYDAAVYCAWRNARLPNHIEWEYAARGTAASDFPWGNEFDGNSANFCDTNCTLRSQLSNQEWDDGFAELAPITSYPQGQSWVGAYNLAGNGAEWTSSQRSYGDANAVEPGDYNIVKGGNYLSPSVDLLSASIAWVKSENSLLGFRCARTPDDILQSP
jgi:formylglycine-generating enzyme